MSTFGRYLLNEHLPEGHRMTGPMDKRSFSTSMNTLAKRDPATYASIIPRLKRVGDELATQEGLSVGLDDIQPDYAARDQLMRPLRHQFDNATSDARRREVVEKAHNKMLNLANKHKGSMTQQVRSGARGSFTQYQKIVTSPAYARDPQGSVAPWLINQSYSEGLTPGSYWVAGNEAIMDTIKSNTAVAEPGELSKILVNNMNDILVTEDDCNTSNGIMVDPKGSDAVDRYLAKGYGAFRRNMLITPLMQPKLARASSRVMVRSPMTCEAGDGICQKCQGLDEKGQNHVLGTNVGVRAAQAMSEPLTQFALNAKHGVRTIASDKMEVQGMEGFRQIIESPKQFINKATLASIDGKVGGIKKAPQGGHYVNVGTAQHYVTPAMDLRVKDGDTVEAGDALSTGIPKPDEVVKYKGLGAGRLYMVNTLKNLYKNQGREIDQRHFELLAKGELNHVKVLDDSSGNFIPGDIVNYNHLRSQLGASVKAKSLKDSLGETLGKEYLHFSAGTRVKPSVISQLKKAGIGQVVVADRPPEIEFIMKPATRAPLLNPDWMHRLAHRNLKSTLQQAAHFGDVANIHGTSPITSFAMGTEFGEGPKGLY